MQAAMHHPGGKLKQGRVRNAGHRSGGFEELTVDSACSLPQVPVPGWGDEWALTSPVPLVQLNEGLLAADRSGPTWALGTARVLSPNVKQPVEEPPTLPPGCPDRKCWGRASGEPVRGGQAGKLVKQRDGGGPRIHARKEAPES